MNDLKATLVALAGVCIVATAQAQVVPAGGNTTAEAAPEVRRYTVEMIVFEYVDAAASGSELFLPDEPPVEQEAQAAIFGDLTTVMPETGAADPLPAIDLADFEPGLPPGPEELEEIPSHILQTELEVLDAEAYAMAEIYRKLVLLDAYRPIMRAAWIQATHEKDRTKPLRLRRLGNAPLKLDGELMLYLGRYLHLAVDLAIDSGLPAGAIRYRINEDRIFRNGELRYYDHPKFGVLARITRVEEENLETDEEFLLPAGPQDSDSDVSG